MESSCPRHSFSGRSRGLPGGHSRPRIGTLPTALRQALTLVARKPWAGDLQRRRRHPCAFSASASALAPTRPLDPSRPTPTAVPAPTAASLHHCTSASLPRAPTPPGPPNPPGLAVDEGPPLAPGQRLPHVRPAEPVIHESSRSARKQPQARPQPEPRCISRTSGFRITLGRMGRHALVLIFS